MPKNPSSIHELYPSATLARARHIPMLPWVRFSVDELLNTILSTFFPDLHADVQCMFIGYGGLAHIHFSENSNSHTIYFHQALNHPDIPEFVLAFIIKHELLHLVVPHREIDEEWISHPPEFWEAEHELAPERSDAWNWIWGNYWDCLHVYKKLECTHVSPRKWKRVWNQPKLGLSDLACLIPQLKDMPPRPEHFH